ncbi:MAG: glutamine-hydrolyzing carbamoyl-phosphate synthase small subunit [Bacillota bacterium]
MTKGKLVLADGSVFAGDLFGYEGVARGEVVFTTAMTGYLETLTDPSYAGQIVTMTYPLMGNYGITRGDEESDRAHVHAFLVREWSPTPSHYSAGPSLDAYLKEQRVVGLAGLDTRALVRRLRSVGTMVGVIVPAEMSDTQAQALCTPEITDWVGEVAIREPYHLPGDGPHVVVMDFGMKRNILRNLQRLGLGITVVPRHTSAQEILALQPAGLMLTNGPGDPATQVQAINTVRELAGKLPIAGICLGHQIIALAMGAKTYKLPFGHRGANHPVKDLRTGRVCMTSQNHGYAVHEDSLKQTELVVTHREINDQTVEGVMHRHLPIWSVQYHPEGAPGPRDSSDLFDRVYATFTGLVVS